MKKRAGMGKCEDIRNALQETFAPEMKSLKTEIRRLDSKIDSLKSDFTSEFRRVDSTLAAELKRLEEKLNTSVDFPIRSFDSERERESEMASTCPLNLPQTLFWSESLGLSLWQKLFAMI